MSVGAVEGLHVSGCVLLSVMPTEMIRSLRLGNHGGTYRPHTTVTCYDWWHNYMHYYVRGLPEEALFTMYYHHHPLRHSAESALLHSCSA